MRVQVQAYVRTRTLTEVMDFAKHGLAATAAAPGGAGGTAARYSVRPKHAANTVIHSEATSRDTAFTDVQLDRGGVRAHSPLPWNPLFVAYGSAAQRSVALGSARLGCVEYWAVLC